MTASKVIAKAISQIGVTEYPKNSNKVKYNTWYYGKAVSGSAYPWCMAFVQWVFNKVGFPLPLKTASCTALKNYAIEHKKYITKNFKAGDVMLFQFDNDAYSDHTGILEKVDGNYYVCIEGNTSEAGSQSNGGEVLRKRRHKSLVMGAYRPDYEKESAKKETAKKKYAPTIKEWQKAAIADGFTKKKGYFKKCGADGEWGAECEKAAKAALIKKGSKYTNLNKLVQKTLYKLGYDMSSSLKKDGTFDGIIGSGSVEIIKEYQKANKLDADGKIGIKTWRKILNIDE